MPNQYITTPEQDQVLLSLAKRYIWWQSPEASMSDRMHVLARAMDRASTEDFCLIWNAFSEDYIRLVLQNCQPGWITARSWAFWHALLDMLDENFMPPPLPKRTIPNILDIE